MVKILSEETYDKLEKKAKSADTKVVTKLKAERKQLRAELNKAKDNHEDYVAEVNHQREIVATKHDNQLEKINVTVSDLRDKVGFYKNIEADQLELEGRRLDLDNREQELDARAEGEQKLGDTIKDLKVKVDEAEDLGYKKGYGDGVADGLREAHKITAEDRKMAMQIAALAAASHVPAAATEIATKVLADVTKQLSPPSTKKS